MKVEQSLSPQASSNLTLEWKDLSYEIVKKGQDKKILEGLSGSVRSGQLCAILGASGAGKSTFLDTIASRRERSQVGGQVLVNGEKVNIRKLSSYVTQDDILYSNLTVRENIQYSADLSIPRTIPAAERKERVETIIKEFGLSKVQNTKIGNPIVRGVSGGERRRAYIASQVVTLPKILFLDEPTSGLDTAASYYVMNSIQTVAKNHGIAVMATIHQPSPETYALFDKLLLLSAGKTVFFGERQEAPDYFASIGHVVPEHMNPADFFLHLTNKDFMDDKTLADQQTEELVCCWRKQEGKGTGDVQDSNNGSFNIVVDNIAVETKSPSEDIDEIPNYPNNYFVQSWALIRRSFVNGYRNVLVYWIRLAMYIALGLLMGTVWLTVGFEQQDVQDRIGSIWFGVAFLCFMSVAAIPAFLEEFQIYVREKMNHTYSVAAYVTSTFTIPVPFLAIIAILFSCVAYFLIGLHLSAVCFFRFVAFMYLALLVAESLTVLVSAIVPIFPGALAIVAFLNGFFMVVQGFWVRKDSIPKFWIWAHYMDYQKYAYEAMLENDLNGLTFNCARLDDGSCFCSYPSSLPASSCQFTGTDVMHYHGYYDIQMWLWAVALIIMVIGYRGFLFLFLKLRSYKIH